MSDEAANGVIADPREQNVEPYPKQRLFGHQQESGAVLALLAQHA
jgi:hypothetical protein